MLHRLAPLGLVFTLLACTVPAVLAAQVFEDITELVLPIRPGARDPVLARLPNGKVAIAWTEPDNDGYAVQLALGDSTGFGAAHTVVQGNDLYVNWADVPAITALQDGTLAASWLRINGKSDYAYDVNLALSHDEGVTWGKPLVPHSAAIERQHGFVTLLPVSPDSLEVIWLDGRNYGGSVSANEAQQDSMQLRAITVQTDGVPSDEELLDDRTCTCCQTSATLTSSGALLVAYRDRTQEEIRDISVIRHADSIWSKPVTIGADGWQIAGCPINGPAIDSAAGKAVVAWFTAAKDVPKVAIAFSDDDGIHFGPAIQVDQGNPLGRVDIVQLEDGSAIVSWLELTGLGEALMVCRATAAKGCDQPKILSLSRSGRTMGFPHMALGADGLYIAWTQATAQSANPDQDTTIRLVVARLAKQP